MCVGERHSLSKAVEGQREVRWLQGETAMILPEFPEENLYPRPGMVRELAETGCMFPAAQD